MMFYDFMKIFITSGGTKVPIDEVRAITNNSKGTYAAAIASRFAERLHPKKDHLYFSYSKDSMHPAKNYPQGFFYELVGASFNDYVYETYNEYVDKNIALIESIQPDIIISAAAVSDYDLAPTEGKMDSGDELILKLTRTKKVIPLMRQKAPKAMIIGFKLLVAPSYEQVQSAVRKVLNNGADYVVYNDLRELRKGNPQRLIFSKDLSFQIAPTASALVDIVRNLYEQKQITVGLTTVAR